MKSHPSLGRMIALFLLVTVGLSAGENYNQNKRGLAIKGYDTVAYFIAGEPTKGTADFTHEWGGATWRFASAENLQKFIANPERYAPQYGGYCAWAVSQGYTAPVSPKAWKIVDGKLYLNYNRDVQTRWEADHMALIKSADGNWPALRDE